MGVHAVISKIADNEVGSRSLTSGTSFSPSRDLVVDNELRQRAEWSFSSSLSLQCVSAAASDPNEGPLTLERLFRSDSDLDSGVATMCAVATVKVRVRSEQALEL